MSREAFAVVGLGVIAAGVLASDSLLAWAEFSADVGLEWWWMLVPSLGAPLLDLALVGEVLPADAAQNDQLDLEGPLDRRHGFITATREQHGRDDDDSERHASNDPAAYCRVRTGHPWLNRENSALA